MLAFYVEVADEDLSHRNVEEVDDARWFTYPEASDAVLKGAVAERLLKEVSNRFN
jgi:NADH pyrophosphatase NudC (nudix superfamily)